MKVKIVSTVEQNEAIHNWIFPRKTDQSVFSDDWSIIECGYKQDHELKRTLVDGVLLTKYDYTVYEIFQFDSEKDANKFLKKWSDFAEKC
ncbi:hypothetical protein LCGC14_1051020 [marine sediment metagenome]|uniref:Uncharacterized protein n=1 Tax=marine sediment metagenome TaxID=412755 RepID=A0A0F9Q6X7_9ZZZZ